MAARSLRLTRLARGGLLVTLCACGVLLAAGSARTDGPPLVNEYVVQDVGFAPPPSSTIQWFPAINSRGQVAGGTTVPGPGVPQFHAARSNGALTSFDDLGVLAGGYSNGFGINVNQSSQEAQVVGESTASALGNIHGFRFSDSPPGLEDLGALGGAYSSAFKINAFGEAVGEADDGDLIQATLWDASGIHGLGFLSGGAASSAKSINDSHWVVGHSEVDIPMVGTQIHAFLNTPDDGMIDVGTLPDGDNSTAWDVNDSNPVQIVGQSTTNFGSEPHAFRHTVSPFPSKIDLGMLDGDNASIAFAVNNSGVVVGTSYVDDPPITGHAFIWQDVNGNGAADSGEMRDLNNLLPPNSGWSLYAATDINDAGQIVGYGIHNGQPAVFRLSPPDAGAPSVSPFNYPLEFTANGGTETICANVDEDIALDHVKAIVSLPGGGTADVPMTLVGGNLYCGFFNTDSNSGSTDETYSVDVEAEDDAGNVTTKPGSDFVVHPNAVPQIPDCSITPLTRTASGGDFQIRAHVTDDTGVTFVEARITLPNMSLVTLTLNQEGTTDFYSNTYTAPANNTNGDQTYHVDIRADDNFDETTTESCGDFKVLKNAPPVITNPSITPSSRNANGGVFHISANVTDDISVSSVVARVTKPDTTTVDVALTLQSGSLYAGDYIAPGNFSSGDETYSAQIRATDGFNALSTLPAGSFVVMENVAPIIVSCSVSPPLLPHTGGTATLTAHLQDETGVDHATAAVTGPGVNSTFSLSKSSGTVFDGVWTGTFNLPANVGINVTHFQFSLTAVDDRDAATTGDCGEVAVEDFIQDTQPPAIHSCSLSSHFISSGSNLTITANVTDNIAVASVVAHVSSGGPPIDVPLNPIGADQYQGTQQISAPGDATTVFTVTIEALDVAGNQASETCGSVRVSSTKESAPGRVQVDPRKLVFGKLTPNTSKVLSFTVKHLGGSDLSILAFQVGGARAPFEILDGLGAFGTNGGFITLTPGQKKTIRVRFRPPAVGHYIQQMTVLTNDPDQPSIPVTLDGKGCRAQ